uniref:Lysine--tRNA ligase n=1 Tax=Anthurium amnicola TaxID=1678845 RepID=A0A1D1Y8Y1_9ARAE
MAITVKGFCVFLCLITLALYVSSSQASTDSTPPASSSTPASLTPHELSGRQLMNPSSSSTPRGALGARRTQVDGKMERPQMRGDRVGEVDENGEEGLIYNADYPGARTHPVPPLPRHPKP